MRRNLLEPVREDSEHQKSSFAFQNRQVPSIYGPQVITSFLKYTRHSLRVGVILLCFLSGRYPFFHSPDDLTALAELGALFGTKELSHLARLFEKQVEFPEEFPAWDLPRLCQKLNSRNIGNIPSEAFDLLQRCLELNPATRISATEALKHPFLATPLVEYT